MIQIGVTDADDVDSWVAWCLRKRHTFDVDLWVVDQRQRQASVSRTF